MTGEIKQRSPGSWQIRVFLGRDEHGKRIRKNETVRGKKADAERRKREILGDLDRGVVPSVERYKLAEWLQFWLVNVIAPKKEQKTFDRYEEASRLHVVPELGNVEISKLSPRHVQELETKLLRDGMAPKGVQMVHIVLSGALKHALRMELISRDPVALVPPPSVPKTEANSPNMEQVKALIAQGASTGHYLWPCVYLIIYTGMRRGVGVDVGEPGPGRACAPGRGVACHCKGRRHRKTSENRKWATDGGPRRRDGRRAPRA